MNEDLMTKTELETYRLRRTIEAFKKYDAERKEYVHKLERRLQDLEYLYEDYKAMYEELTGNADSPLVKMTEKCKKYKQTIKSYQSQERASSLIRKYVDKDGKMDPWFAEIVEETKNIDKILNYRGQINTLKTQNKKLKECLSQAINELIKEKRKNEELSSTAPSELTGE